jgi:signal transduction histidine kinase
MELIALSAAQPPPEVTDVSSEVNSAAWGTLLWVAVIAVVFFVLLAAAGLSLVSGRKRTRG